MIEKYKNLRSYKQLFLIIKLKKDLTKQFELYKYKIKLKNYGQV